MSEKVVRIHEDKQIPPGSGGGTMEARVARLEASVSHIEKDVAEIKTDLRLLLGAIITTALGLAALMAKGFRWF